jgi:dTMP kinase
MSGTLLIDDDLIGDMASRTDVEKRATSMDQAISSSSKGRFYVLEGIDGAGKSSLMKELVGSLSLRWEVVETMEPSPSWIGDAVRRANAEDVDPYAEALLFVADRAEHTRQIAQWLDEGKVVLCDRYYASTLAYQSVILHERLGADAMDWLREVNAPVIRLPDITFLLDIAPEASLQRIGDREETTKFEKLAFLQEVREAYLEVSREDLSMVVVDASKPRDQVLGRVLQMMESDLQGAE